MATNAQLTGSVAVALDGSKVSASGQFTTSDGFAQSESIDLTAMMTASAKTSVLQLMGLLNQQYQILRQNLLSQPKCFLTDLSYLSGVKGATVAADTTTAYAGAQSAKVTTPGAAVGEGVLLALGSVPKATTATVTVLVALPQGVSVAATLTDTANMNNSYTAVSPATTPASYTETSAAISATSAAVVGGATAAWQAVTVSVPVGSAAAPVLTLSLVTTAKVAAPFWLGAVQVTAA